MRLACYALALGVEDYKGPDRSRKAASAQKAKAEAAAVTPTD